MNTNKKDKKYKNDISNSSSNNSNAITFYEQNFGFLTPFNADLLTQLIQEHGEELVIEAMKVALKKNARNLTFVETVLMNWHEQGVRTVTDAQAAEREFRLRVMKGGVSRGAANRKTVPLYTRSDEGSTKKARISHYQPGKWNDVELDKYFKT